MFKSCRKRLRIESLESRQLLSADGIQVESVDDVFQAVEQRDIAFDLNEDGNINTSDATFLVEEILGTRWGDNDLDGQVNFEDFLRLSSHFGNDEATFAQGDTDGDGKVGFSDFLRLSNHFGFANRDRMVDLRDGVNWLPNRTVFELMAHTEDLPGAQGVREVKFMIDLARGDIAYVNQNQHQFHYHFTRAAWGYRGTNFQFNQETYFSNQRRFLAGSVVAHDNYQDGDQSGIYTIEFWPTDPVSANHVIYAVAKVRQTMGFTQGRLAYHPSGETQRALYEREKASYDNAGTPIIATEQLFGNQTFAPLNAGVGYGRLRVVDASNTTPLTARDLVIFENIPNDLPHVAGVITVQPQTPLSHVNLRSKQNNTPNAYIRDALTNPLIQSLIGKSVRFEVVDDRYAIREATDAEIEEHFATIRPTEVQQPRRDLDVQDIAPLATLRTADQTAYGAKAANLGELARILPDEQVPDGYAVPFAFYDEFMRANGFYEDAQQMIAEAAFQADPATRERQLAIFRNRIERGTVPEQIRTELDQTLLALRTEHGQERGFRARSSTNNEDLVGFTGAGLYESYTHRPDEGRLENTIRQVWAGLWTFRAFEEREFWRIDHFQAAMGVAIHPNFDDEQANGVAITKNIFDPNWEGFYVNVQVGEDLVTNPGPNDVPDEFLISAIGQNREWETQFIRYSNLTADGQPVMDAGHVGELVSAMRTIQRHFRQVYDVQGDPDFAMDIEFKVDAMGQLVIKQARPWVD